MNHSRTTIRDLTQAKGDLLKSAVIDRVERLLTELKTATEATTATDFEKHIHLARLQVDKVGAELGWYFGGSL